MPAGFLLTIVLAGYVKMTRGVYRTTHYSHACELYGYEWHRFEGESLPTVRANPALVPQGEERLRQARQIAPDEWREYFLQAV